MNRRTVAAGMVLIACLALQAGCTKGGREKVLKNPLPSAEATVKEFCAIDGDAARLASRTWSKVQPYIAWTEEAGWDRTVVIRGFRIEKSENRSETVALVTVVYDVAGNLSQDYMPAGKQETVVFTVQRTDDGWKIKDPDFMPPHVLMQPLIRHLEETRRLEQAGKVREAAGGR